MEFFKKQTVAAHKIVRLYKVRAKMIITLQQMMCHVYDHPVTANCVAEYSDSYSFGTYTHLAQLF